MNATALQEDMDATKQARLGSFLLGFATDAILWGVMSQQFINWTVRERQDRLFVKLVVYWLVFMATVTTGVAIAWMFSVFVVGFGDFFAGFFKLQWLSWYPILDILTIVPTQVFYLDRAWRLSKSRWVPILLIPLMLSAMGGAIATRVIADGIDVTQIRRLRVSFYLRSVSTVGVDVGLAGTILWCLLRARSAEAHHNALIMRLIRLSIESQLPGTIVELILTLQFATSSRAPTVPYYIIMHSKVYVVTLLALLNTRHAIRRDLNLTSAIETCETNHLRRPSEPIQTLDSAAKGLRIQHASLEPAHLPHHATLRFAEV